MLFLWIYTFHFYGVPVTKITDGFHGFQRNIGRGLEMTLGPVDGVAA